jgi:peptide/nickel transport system substrate-binding protein
LNFRLVRSAAALTVALSLAGCGGNETSSDASSVLTIARVKDAVGLDPAHETDGLSFNVTSQVLQGLVAFKPGTFDVIPAIAKSWSTSPDGTVWTFKLNEGLKFSDGTPLDAEAVKFNFDRWRLKSNPYHGNYPYPYYQSYFAGFPGLIKDVKVLDPATVKVTLAAPQGPFLRNIASSPFAIGSPAAIEKDMLAYALAPTGSGPYILAEWVKDDHITLTANPSWTGPKPVYTRVIVRDIPDQSTSVLSLQKGDIDGLTDPRPDDAKAFAGNKDVVVYRQPANNVAYLALNVEKKPFDDVRVRQAVAYAVDVNALVKGLYGEGAVVNGNFTPPGMLGENPALKPYPQDIAKAKSLLAAAGFPNGLKTELFFGTAPRPYLPEPQRVAEAIQSDLRKAGIEVTLEPYEWGVYLQKIRNGEHPLALIGWTGDNGDPDNFFYPLLDRDSAIKGQAQNISFWKDPKFHELIIAGQRTVDDAKRRSIYMRANAMVHEQVPVVAFVHAAVPLVMSAKVGGVIPRPDSILNFELMHPKAVSK